MTVVKRSEAVGKRTTVGSLDAWGWRELKALAVPWFDGFARTLSKVEPGVWPRGFARCLHCYDPQAPLGQRPVVYRIWGRGKDGPA